MRKKVFFSFCLLLSSLVILIIASTIEAGHSHYQLVDFYKILKKEPDRIQQKRVTLYGSVKEGSIEKKGIKARFILQEENKSLMVHFTGKTLLPDTFKEGSLASVDGFFNIEENIFVADKVLAKCASRYESNYEDSL